MNLQNIFSHLRGIILQFILAAALLALAVGCDAVIVPGLPGVQSTEVPSTAQPTSAPADLQPTISLNPMTGGGGTQVAVSGTGFPAGAHVTVHLGPPNSEATSQAYGEATADTEGKVALQFGLPETWPDGKPIEDQELVVMVATDDFRFKGLASFAFQPANLVTITGQIKDIAASARVLNLTETVEGFNAVAVTDQTQFITKDDSVKSLADLKPGMKIEATGKAGGSSAVVATEIRILALPAPAAVSGQWQRVQIGDIQLSFEVPGGWKQQSKEWVWANPKAAGQIVGIKWIKRQGGVEPTSILPNRSTSLDAAPLEVKWGPAMKHTVEVTNSAAGGGNSVAVETHVVVLTDKLVVDVYASAPSPDELDTLWPTVQHMLDSAK